MRITKKQLEARVERLNEYAKNLPIHHKPQYQLSCACGGYALHRVINERGGIIDVFGYGHIPGRELYQMITAMIYGITLASNYLTGCFEAF